jgi:hypothetical protein
LEGIHGHVDHEQDEAQVDELDPADGSDRLGYNLLLIDRSRELSSLLNNCFHGNISNNNENSNSCDGKHDYNILVVPFAAMGQYSLLVGEVENKGLRI